MLGVVSAAKLDVDPGTPVRQVMQSSPVTFRPDLALGMLPDYAKTRRIACPLVTTSDGALTGPLDVDDTRAASAVAT